MYNEACRICEDPAILKAYLYSCYRALPKENYVKMLSGNPVYLSMDSLLREDIKRIEKETDMDVTEEQFVQWKKDYRRIDKNRGIC